MRTVCWKASSAASTGMLAMKRMSSGLMLFMNGPGTRSMALEKMRNPKTAAETGPIGFHRASASRHDVMPRNAIIRPQPSIEWGNDQSVSSRSNAVCQMPSKKPSESSHDEAATGERDRPGHREREGRKRECVAEPAPQIRREGEVGERQRGAQMHRVDEEMRRREEILERMRRVPLTIPPEPDAEREDVEDDREPEQTVRGVEADAIRGRLGRRKCGCGHAGMVTSMIEPTWHRMPIGGSRNNVKSLARSLVAQW